LYGEASPSTQLTAWEAAWRRIVSWERCPTNFCTVAYYQYKSTCPEANNNTVGIIVKFSREEADLAN